MRILVTGSRDWEGPWAENRVAAVLRALEIVAKTVGSEPFTVVHGGCPTGADAIADRWCRRRWYEPEIHEPRWDPNEELVNAGADICVAFLKDEEDGATSDLARQVGIWTIVIPWEPEEQEPEDKLPMAA